MHTNPKAGAKIASPETNSACVREPDDWWPCREKTLVGHLPTHSIFAFYPVPGKAPDDLLALADFRARLVHVCPGHPHPTPAELTRLCREAPVMGLFFLGLADLLGRENRPAEAPLDDECPF